MEDKVREVISGYLLAGKREEKSKYEEILVMVMEYPLVFDKVIQEVVSELDKKLETMEKDNLSPEMAAVLIFDITIMLDAFIDIVYSLKNRNYLFNSESVDNIKSYFTNFNIGNRIINFSKKYNVPITLALPCDFVGKELQMLYMARRGEASVVLDKVFNDLLDKESLDWEKLVFGLDYDETNSEWNKVLGGIDKNGNKIYPSSYMIAIAELLESHGYKLPHVIDGKVVY